MTKTWLHSYEIPRRQTELAGYPLPTEPRAWEGGGRLQWPCAEPSIWRCRLPVRMVISVCGNSGCLLSLPQCPPWGRERATSANPEYCLASSGSAALPNEVQSGLLPLQCDLTICPKLWGADILLRGRRRGTTTKEEEVRIQKPHPTGILLSRQ